MLLHRRGQEFRHAYGIKKNWLITLAYNDHVHSLLTYFTAVKRFSQRLILTIVVADDGMIIFLHNETRAYVQADITDDRTIFLILPTSLEQQADTLLCVESPLYGQPESGLHWFTTCHRYNTLNLQLTGRAHNHCWMYLPSLLSTYKEERAEVYLRTKEHL